MDAKLALAVTASQPWYRMTFFDDSDFAPLAQGAAEVTDVSRGEDFVHAGVSAGEMSLPSTVRSRAHAC